MDASMQEIMSARIGSEKKWMDGHTIGKKIIIPQ